jgi:hypothetical protein
MRRLTSLLLLLAVSVMLSACGTLLYGTVSRFHIIDSSPKTFFLMAAEEQKSSLEFQTYANLVKSELTSRGWSEGSFEAADVAIFLEYQISGGRVVNYSYPIMGQVPSGTSTTNASASTIGGYTTATATTTQQMTTRVVGTGTGSVVQYDRLVTLRMVSIPEYLKTKEIKPVFESSIASTGTSGTLPEVMPTLIRGLFKTFPGESGKVDQVTLPIR